MLALGSTLAAAGALSLVATASPASATTTVLYATVDCSNVNYSGDTRDWYPTGVWVSPGGAVPYSSMVADPATHAWQFSETLPAGTTSVSAGAKCSGGHQYDLPGTSFGSVSVPAGTNTVTATWSCYTAQVYPGPYVTNCSVQSVSST
jgi:hypothetical protein